MEYRPMVSRKIRTSQAFFAIELLEIDNLIELGILFYQHRLIVDFFCKKITDKFHVGRYMLYHQTKQNILFYKES